MIFSPAALHTSSITHMITHRLRTFARCNPKVISAVTSDGAHYAACFIFLPLFSTLTYVPFFKQTIRPMSLSVFRCLLTVRWAIGIASAISHAFLVVNWSGSSMRNPRALMLWVRLRAFFSSVRRREYIVDVCPMV